MDGATGSNYKNGLTAMEVRMLVAWFLASREAGWKPDAYSPLRYENLERRLKVIDDAATARKRLRPR